jgi:protein-disulfide isomerase/plastocyanin
MKITIFFLLPILLLGFAMSDSIPIQTAFAEVTVTTGSVPLSAPGCEETNECYTPGDTTVDVGGKVIMTNTDSTGIHTFTSGTVDGFAASPDGKFDSGILNADQSFEWSPDAAGEYPYYCMLHVWMQGTITVQEAMVEETMMEEKEVMEMETMMVGDVDVTMSPPIEGSEDATVTIIEFGDFQCPKCDQWFLNEKPTIKSEYIDTGKANLYFVDFSFLGNDSNFAAEAAYCAEDQGKYLEYHSYLYNNQGGINEGWASSDNLKQYATDIGLGTMKFNSCFDSGKYTDRVLYNTDVGVSNGVEGTPVFFIIGSDGSMERIDGPQSSTIFADVIDSMLGEAMAQEMETDVMEEEMMMETEDISEKEGGGCLIATAAYGSELAPQVQFLREIRDNTVMSTTSGAAFMTGFNQFYYSFSPVIADMERENPMFQDAVRAFITPMVSTLSIMTLADGGSEIEVLGFGISVIALNLGMYIAAPAAVGFTIHRKIKSRK